MWSPPDSAILAIAAKGVAVLAKRTNSLLACACVVLLAAGALGCGSSGANSSSARERAALAAAVGKHDGDGDDDSFGQGPADTDKDAIATYGPAADPTERQAIVSVIRRYYAAAAADDGAEVCSLTYSLFAESLVEAHSRGRGAPALRGDSCAQVAAKLLAGRHSEIARDLAALRVTVIQLRERQGWAVARFGIANERIVQLQHLPDGAWAMNVLLYRGSI
jgi:hypothetical protein